MAHVDVSSEGSIAEAAQALGRADYVIVAAGAGFSADSGLPTYEECQASGRVDYDELARAELLYEDPSRFYGFWLGSLQRYREARPHAGYSILERLLRTRAAAGKVFIYTTNVDGHFRHLQGLGFSLCEVHGCCEEWLCSSTLPYAAVELLEETPQSHQQQLGDVVAMEGERFRHVRQEQQRLLELEAARGGTQLRQGCAKPRILPAPPDCGVQVDHSTGRALLPEGDQQERGSGEQEWSRCPLRCGLCKLPLRPSVLMFADEDATLLRFLHEKQAAYQRWEDAMEEEIEASSTAMLGRPKCLVILELGAGRRVEAIRRECEDVRRDVAAKGGEATQIRINPCADANTDVGAETTPDEASGGDVERPRGRQRLIHLRMSALAALQGIEDVLSSQTAEHQTKREAQL